MVQRFFQQKANPDLKWEETKAYNVGLDLSFFDNRIEFIIDAYLKKTDNLLMQATLPSYIINNDYMGMTAPWVNTGAIENKGIEFTLNTVNIIKKTGNGAPEPRSRSTATNSRASTPPIGHPGRKSAPRSTPSPKDGSQWASSTATT